jgi:hypothetical protein
MCTICWVRYSGASVNAETINDDIWVTAIWVAAASAEGVVQ